MVRALPQKTIKQIRVFTQNISWDKHQEKLSNKVNQFIQSICANSANIEIKTEAKTSFFNSFILITVTYDIYV